MSCSQPCSRVQYRFPLRIGALVPAGRVPEEDIPGVDDAREPSQDGQKDVDPKVDLETAVEEYSQGRDEDGEDEEDDIGSTEASLSDGRGGGYRLFIRIGACCRRAVGRWCRAGGRGSTGRGIGLGICRAGSVVGLACQRCASASRGRGGSNMMGLLRRRVRHRGRCRICL